MQTQWSLAIQYMLPSRCCRSHSPTCLLGESTLVRQVSLRYLLKSKQGNAPEPSEGRSLWIQPVIESRFTAKLRSKGATPFGLAARYLALHVISAHFSTIATMSIECCFRSLRTASNAATKRANLARATRLCRTSNNFAISECKIGGLP